MSRTQFELYMALSGNREQMVRIFSGWDWEEYPVNILFSYAYPQYIEWFFDEVKPFPRPAKLMLDSGAFTASTLGIELCVEEYIDYIHNSPIKWDEVIALDVIGDHVASYNNAVLMEDEGIRVVPTYHEGEPMEALHQLCHYWEKVALGGIVGSPKNNMVRFFKQCFKECWPHRFHSFGCCLKESLDLLPFVSADSSTWLSQIVRWAKFACYKHRRISGLKGDTLYWASKADALEAVRFQREYTGRWAQVYRKVLDSPSELED